MREFGWDVARLVTLEHSTLPWFGNWANEICLDAVPLGNLGSGGTREAFSVVGQFAAHLAFLRFAGLSTPEFDAAEWVVVRKRSSDSRLVRVHAGEANGSGDIPSISTIESFARLVGAGSLRSLRQPWCKPEVVYQELEQKLRGDVRADLSWFRRAALGWIFSPGADGVRALRQPGTIVVYREVDAPSTVRRFCALNSDRPLIVFGEEATPLQRYSAIGALGRLISPLSGNESAIAERAADEITVAIVILENIESFDESSRKTIRLLRTLAPRWSWLVPPEAKELLGVEEEWEEEVSSSPFIVSPRIAPAKELYEEAAQLTPRERFQWLTEFVQGDSFRTFLDHGTVPLRTSSAVDSLFEPRRSYLAAVALLGSSVEIDLAKRFLHQLGCGLDPEQLAVDGIAAIQGSRFCFAGEPVRRRLAGLMTPPSRATLASLAAGLLDERGEHRRAAHLHLAAGEEEKAIESLRRTDWSGSDVLEALRGFPSRLFCGSAELARLYATALIEDGRYADAGEILGAVPSADRQLLSARIERRLGNYKGALQALGESVSDFESLLLRGELYRLAANYDQAQTALAAAGPLARTAREKARLQYERAILARDRHHTPVSTPHLDEMPYLAARLHCYVATGARDYVQAVAAAQEALREAEGIAEAIDASLDLLYAHFLAGDWEAARHQARQTLALVEETQGDRAAGGVLFTLAYLCADSAHWAEAEHALARLRSFFRETGDERRLDELRMLAAHLDLCRGRHREARQHLAGGADPRWSTEIREAASLVLDEIDWIEGKLVLVRTTGESACVELTRRHLLNTSRARGHAGPEALDPFSRSLFQWELGIETAPAPVTRSEKLRLHRAARAILTRRADASAEKLARSIADELTIEHQTTPTPEHFSRRELELLQRLALASFPLEPGALGDVSWRFLSRNRLGQWSQFGSLPPVDPSTLPEFGRSDAPMDNWIVCSESRFLFIEGLDQFSASTREAIRELFRVKSEHFKLLRIAEQEQTVVADKPSPPADGILGESPAIREITAMLERLARRDVAVCILGESGTGKELFARAVHLRSPRRSKPFTAVNCAALPENLVESELFGHTRGAFTGADRDRAGLLEVTDGGTLFLDEIGELPPNAQAKLLRFLQEGEYRRVGETPVRHADVRVIAATNRKLEEWVDNGRFREDLYYRVRGVELQVPPLRERSSDILLLAKYFLECERERHRAGADRFSEEVEAIFLSYDWPGNIRELQNTVRAAHALAGERKVIDVEHLPKRLQSVLVVRTPHGTYYEELLRFRRNLIEKSLAESGGNQNRAAKALGMTRQALSYQIRELGIMVRDHRK